MIVIWVALFALAGGGLTYYDKLSDRISVLTTGLAQEKAERAGEDKAIQIRMDALGAAASDENPNKEVQKPKAAGR
jgi:hypothetical protein